MLNRYTTVVAEDVRSNDVLESFLDQSLFVRRVEKNDVELLFLV